MSKQQTVRDILQQVYEAFEQAELFYGHGSDNAWDEAVALVFLTATTFQLNLGLKNLQECFQI